MNFRTLKTLIPSAHTACSFYHKPDNQTKQADSGKKPSSKDDHNPGSCSMPVRILFVCHGNICRSVMAQWIMQDLADQNSLADAFVIDSAALTDDETGNPIYYLARQKLSEKGIPIGHHFARRITRNDYDRFDHIFIMDDENDWMIRRLFAGDPAGKIDYLLPGRQEIDDPWYTRDFESCYQEILDGCKIRLKQIVQACCLNPAD